MRSHVKSKLPEEAKRAEEALPLASDTLEPSRTAAPSTRLKTKEKTSFYPIKAASCDPFIPFRLVTISDIQTN